MEFGSWDLAVAVAKAISYASTLAGSGGVLFLSYNVALRRHRHGEHIARVLGALLLIAAAVTGVKILLAAGSMGDGLAGMIDPANSAMIWHAGEGRAAALRLAGLFLACGVVFKMRAWRRLAPVGAVLAATSFAWVGHAHAVRPNMLPLLLLSVHLLGVAFWLGSLWPLMQAARHADGAFAAELVTRFSRVAIKVVAALLLAGMLLLILLLQHASDLWMSDYGRLVILKLFLVAGLLAVAAFNKLALTPRLLAGDAQAFKRLRRSITIELMFGGSILMVTALFTTLAGPPH